MKIKNLISRYLVLFCLLSLEPIIHSSPRCLGCTSFRFRKGPLEIVECNCPCQNYPRSKHADGYACLVCGHKLIPRDIEPIVLKLAAEMTEEIDEDVDGE